MTKELEGQELSDYNAAQSAIKRTCIDKNKCWKDDPYTCPMAQLPMTMDLCTLHEEGPEKPKEKTDALYLKCPYDHDKLKALPRCYNCYRNVKCPKFRDYIKEEGKK